MPLEVVRALVGGAQGEVRGPQRGVLWACSRGGMMHFFRTHNYVELVVWRLLLHFRNYAEVPNNFAYSNWGTSVFRTIADNRCYSTFWYENKRTYAIGWRTRCPKYFGEE
jgi:hypothetical protein